MSRKSNELSSPTGELDPKNTVQSLAKGFRALQAFTAEEAVARHPTRLVEDAVRRMLPRTALGRALMRKLKVYPGDKHPHAAQKPTAMEAVNA